MKVSLRATRARTYTDAWSQRRRLVAHVALTAAASLSLVVCLLVLVATVRSFSATQMVEWDDPTLAVLVAASRGEFLVKPVADADSSRHIRLHLATARPPLDFAKRPRLHHALGFGYGTEWSAGASRLVLMLPAWFVVLPTLLLPAWWYRNGKIRLRLKRRRQGMCIFCGYDTRSSPDRCPECGRLPGNPFFSP